MRNPFKASLKRGDKLIGLWLSLAGPYSTEVCATAGFHWVLIDNEHAPNDVRSTLAQLQAVAAYPSQRNTWVCPAASFQLPTRNVGA